MIPDRWADKKTNIEEWLTENIHCDGFGGDLQEKWVQMGLHGIRVVWEDYPGGIYRKKILRLRILISQGRFSGHMV